MQVRKTTPPLFNMIALRPVSVALAIAGLLFVPVTAQSTITEPDVDGFYTQLCGSGRVIYISLSGDDKDRETPHHKMPGCHAVCAQRQDKIKQLKS